MLKFINVLNQCTPDRIEQRKQLTYTVAIALGMLAPLPNSNVEEPYEYYIANYKDKAMSIVANINELVVFDTELTLKLAADVWLERYELVYPPTLYYLTTKLGRGLSNLSEEDIKYISSNGFSLSNIFDILVQNNLLTRELVCGSEGGC